MTGSERVDVVVVGARPAGSAAATALARAGRRVVALDRASFPSETLSTHLLFLGGVVELARLGALERVEAVGAPRMPEAVMDGAAITVRGSYTPVEGLDFALCVRRLGLDSALVETAREAGAEVRERAKVTELVWEDGRAAGVRWVDADGAERELRAPLVVGADGRRSLVARAVGAEEPHRFNPNGRACFYTYVEDTRADWRATAAQWRAGRELGTVFPCDEGLALVLFMPPRDRFESARDFDWDAELARLPRMRDRLEGCPQVAKVRSALDTTSFFRRSAGPGWALPGDAGHFKDPVTAQGIRDAMRFGRLLGEAAAPVLDDPVRLDRELRRWERGRDRECFEMYAWTNTLARGEAMTPLEVELYRAAADDPALATRVLDVFSRTTHPSTAIPAGVALAMTARAWRRNGDRRSVLAGAAQQTRDAAAMWRARLAPAG